MENNTQDYVYNNVVQLDEAEASRKFLAKVFTWMFVGLGISAFFAFEFFQDKDLTKLILDPHTNRFWLYSNICADCFFTGAYLGWVRYPSGYGFLCFLRMPV